MLSAPLTPPTGFALEVFLLDGQARQLAPASIRTYRQQLQWLLDYLATQSCHALPELTAHHIRAYLLYLQEERNWKPASVHSAARAIRAFLNFCTAEGMVTTNPMARVKMPKVRVELQPAFEAEEIRTLLKVTQHQRDRTLVLCLLDSGCRAREFLAWDVSDSHLPNGTVRVRKTKNGHEHTV